MKKQFADEQVISILREAEAGATSSKALCKKHNITEQTFFRWRNRFGGMDVPQVSGNYSTCTAVSHALYNALQALVRSADVRGCACTSDLHSSRWRC